MVKKIRAALIMGTGAIAYKALTKKPLLTDENVRNGTIGAVVGMMGLPKLEGLVKGEYDFNKRLAGDTVVGSLGGAAIGYLLSNRRKRVSESYED